MRREVALQIDHRSFHHGNFILIYVKDLIFIEKKNFKKFFKIFFSKNFFSKIFSWDQTKFFMFLGQFDELFPFPKSDFC
jgi:hypothetical protein